MYFKVINRSFFSFVALICILQELVHAQKPQYDSCAENRPEKSILLRKWWPWSMAKMAQFFVSVVEHMGQGTLFAHLNWLVRREYL